MPDDSRKILSEFVRRQSIIDFSNVTSENSGIIPDRRITLVGTRSVLSLASMLWEKAFNSPGSRFDGVNFKNLANNASEAGVPTLAYVNSVLVSFPPLRMNRVSHTALADAVE